MNGLLSKEMLADLAINIVNIVILFLVTKGLVYKPVKKYLTARKEKLAAAAESAAAQQAQAEETQKKYEALLSETDQMKARLIAEAEAEARARADAVAADAAAEAEQTLQQAREDAQREKQRAVADAKSEIAELSFALAGKIMGRAADDADARRAAGAFFEERKV